MCTCYFIGNGISILKVAAGNAHQKTPNSTPANSSSPPHTPASSDTVQPQIIPAESGHFPASDEAIPRQSLASSEIILQQPLETIETIPTHTPTSSSQTIPTQPISNSETITVQPLSNSVTIPVQPSAPSESFPLHTTSSIYETSTWDSYPEDATDYWGPFGRTLTPPPLPPPLQTLQPVQLQCGK